MLAPLLEMAEARQHDAELQQLKARLLSFLPQSQSPDDVRGSEYRTNDLPPRPH